MLGFRRTRKSSPEPEDRSIENGDPYSSTSQQLTPQNRRRTKHVPSMGTSPNTVRKKAVSLPLYHAPGSSTCNNFLLGGHYYPGKDKKAMLIRRRTLWYRMFCSSTWRTILSLIISTYILLWQVLVPTFHVVLDYGKLLAGERRAMAGMHLFSIDEQRRIIDRVKRIKDNLNANSRVRMLEMIVPEFYHRNDEKYTNLNNEDHKEYKDATISHDVENLVLERHQDSPARQNKHVDHVSLIGQKESDLGRSHPTFGGTVPEPDLIPKDVEAFENHVDSPTENIDHSTKGYHGAEKRNEGSKATKNLNNVMKSHQTRIVTDPTRKKAALVKREEETSRSTGHANVKLNEPEQVLERNLLNMENFSNHSRCPGFVKDTKITLVIQCSLDRMWILRETCHRWRDPIIVVVYCTNKEPSFDEWKALCPQLTVVPYVPKSTEKEWHYPVNQMRNLGLDFVQTSHVVVMDADFVPSQDLDQTIRVVLEDRRHQRMVAESRLPDENHDAIVIPAFERVGDCSTQNCTQFLSTNSSFLPNTIHELQDCVRSQNCVVFQSRNNWEVHYSTQSHLCLKKNIYERKDNIVYNNLSTNINRIPC